MAISFVRQVNDLSVPIASALNSGSTPFVELDEYPGNEHPAHREAAETPGP